MSVPAVAIDTSTPLGHITQATDTCLWNDSANPAELEESITFGAVGATCNPVIAVTCVKQDWERWKVRIAEIAQEHPSMSAADIGWRVVEELSVDAARLLMPAFEKYKGVNGRLSMQTDPRLHRDADALVAQAEHFASLAPNIIVKMPATSVGIEAIEEATYRGVCVNVTVSFTVAQAVQTGEAIERGLTRREAEGLPVDDMGPVVTIMVGRLDDWLKEVYERDGLVFDPGYLEWAGVASVKKAYRIFQKRGLRARLLAAGYRNTLQISEFAGGSVVVSPPFKWQKRFQEGGYTPADNQMDVPVRPEIIAALETMPEFTKGWEADSMTPEEFDSYGPTRTTLRQFLAADNELDQLVIDVLVPAP